MSTSCHWSAELYPKLSDFPAVFEAMLEIIKTWNPDKHHAICRYYNIQTVFL
jgi:hypothetical protein